MELVWYRLLSPLLGGSVFTFGLVLAVALAGIGLGGLLYALAAGERPATLSGFVWTCLLEAAAIAGTYALGDRVAVLAVTLTPLASAGFLSQSAGWTLITLVVVLPPSIAAGYQFPLLIALFGRARARLGTEIGLAYAANTFGAIVGSLAGGFGLLPWLSATGAWQLVAAMLIVLAALAVAIDAAATRRFAPPLAGQAALALAAAGLLFSTGPTAVWRHSGIGARRAPPSVVLASAARLRDWMQNERRQIAWDGDGTESAVALAENPAGYGFVINGKADGNARADAGTQIMSGLIGALAAPDARLALVIGLGTGSTAGWLGAVPSLDRVDVVELEPLVLEVARACAAVNQNVLANPKVRIVIGDARETLLTSRERYDIIASEPSNPYRAGIASLFTLEYYRAAASRLSDTGVFVQWVQGYEIDADTLRTIYATLGSVFPQVETWYTNPGDLMLVASKQARTYRAPDLIRRLAQEPFKSAISQAWRTTDIHGVLAHYVANESLARTMAAAPGVEINTDDRNVVEFGLARTVGVTSAMVAEVRNAARAAGAFRPTLTDETGIRWPEVETAWLSYNASQGSFADLRYQGPENEQARQAALVEYYRNGDLERARAYWEQQRDPARDPTEMAMLADLAAATASDLAIPFFDRLRGHRPGEADALLATLRLQQLKLPEAAAAVEAALVRFRTDPWSMQRYMERSVQIALILASRDQGLAGRMFEALGQPFAVRAIESIRLNALAELTRQMDFRGLCGPAVGAFEPHVPWDERFLRLRLDCYQAIGSPRAADATRDLNDFLASQPQPLVKP
jgi:spermidine synthase